MRRNFSRQFIVGREKKNYFHQFFGRKRRKKIVPGNFPTEKIVRGQFFERKKLQEGNCQREDNKTVKF